MDKQLKKDWVAALRSGEFKQGRQMLYNAIENSYCCLGVLCEILPFYERCEGDFDFSFVDDDGGRYIEAGRIHEYEDLIGLDRTVQYWLIEANDSGRYNFNQIADMIEKRVEVSSENNI